jgi:hypothetical protein
MSAVRLAVGTAVVMMTTVLVGCSDDPGDGPDGRDLDADVSVPGWPDQAEVAILSEDVGGGLPPPEPAPARFAEVPDFVLYGDGVAVWRQGGSFLTLTLDREGVQSVLGWATVAGLLEKGGADTGDPEVYDVPSARFELTTDDGSVTTILRAPGLDAADLGLSADAVAARALLAELDDRLRALPDFLGADRVVAPVGPLRAAGWEVLSRRTTTYPDLSGDEPTWPLDDPSVGCRTVTGDDQTRLESLVAAQETDPGSGRVWAFEGAAWVVFARPLLPGAPPGCAGRRTPSSAGGGG